MRRAPSGGTREIAEPPVRTWVVGGGGLLGGAVRRRLERDRLPHVTGLVPWGQPADSVAALLRTADRLEDRGEPWRLAWCAGAGVIGTSQQELDDELRVLDEFLGGLARRVEHPGRGLRSVFLASSAGGVHAGCVDPPFDELTPPVAISPYGDAKLRSEQLVTRFSAGTGVPCLVGRIANLYGPGQDMTKRQGLVSQLCRAHLTRTPVSIYVPLDTARDYLFVDDAAGLVLSGLDRVTAETGTHLKVLASQRTTSVAAILAELRRVTRRRVQVVLGANPNARFQVRDLRFRSLVWPDLDRSVRTTLAAGVSATLASISLQQQAGHLR